MAKRDLNEEAMKTNLDVEVEDKLQGVVPPTYVQAVKDHKENTEHKEEVEDERKEATDKALDNKERIKRNDGSKQMHLEESLFEDVDDDDDDERGEDDDLYELIDVELFGGANYKKNGSKLGLDTNTYPDRDNAVINSKGREKLGLTDTQDAIGVRATGETSEAREAYLKRVRDIVDKLKILYGERVQYKVLGDNKYGVIVYDAETATDDSYESRLKMDSLTAPELKKIKNKIKRFDWKYIEDEDDFRYAVKHAGKKGDFTDEEVEYVMAHKEKFYPRENLGESKQVTESEKRYQLITYSYDSGVDEKFDYDNLRDLKADAREYIVDDYYDTVAYYDRKTERFVNLKGDYDFQESCKIKKGKKPMKMKKELTEGGYYEGEYFCEEIASELENGNEHGYVDTPHGDVSWNVTINGCNSNEFKSNDLFEYLLSDISYPVKDGYLNYIGLDEFISKDSMRYANLDDVVDDLKNIFDVDKSELRKFLKNKNYELEFFIDYDVDFDVEEYERQMLEPDDDYENVNYDRRAVEREYDLEDGELDGVSITDAEDMIGEERGALDRFVIEESCKRQKKGLKEDASKKHNLTLGNQKVDTWFDYYIKVDHTDEDTVKEIYGSREELKDESNYYADLLDNGNKIAELELANFEGVGDFSVFGIRNITSDDLVKALETLCYETELDIEAEFGKTLGKLQYGKTADEVFMPFVKEIERVMNRKDGGVDEGCKAKKDKKELKESFYEGSKVVDDLVDRAKGWIDDGEDIDDAVSHAIDDGLIYTDDIINLGDYYGVIDTSELIDRFYDDLYSDIHKKLSEIIDNGIDESCKTKKGKKSLTEEEDEDELFVVVGYNKDNDVYEDLKLFDNIDDAKRFASITEEEIKSGEIVSESGEPFDWLVIDKYVGEKFVGYYVFYDGDIKGHIRKSSRDKNESLKEDTVKTKSGKWVNKGDRGETHGEFKTKKAADEQRKAMFANKKKGATWGEGLENEDEFVADDDFYFTDKEIERLKDISECDKADAVVESVQEQSEEIPEGISIESDSEFNAYDDEF